MGSLMARGKAVYCIDTSSLVHAWQRSYAPKNFGGFWKNLHRLIRDDRLVSPRQVLMELEEQEDDVLSWVSKTNRKRKLFENTDDDVLSKIERLKDRIMKDYPRLVDNRRGPARVGEGESWADPYIIARALVVKPRPVFVVTEEKPKQTEHNDTPKLGIPDVCNSKKIKIKYTNILGLIRREGWKFK